MASVLTVLLRRARRLVHLGRRVAGAASQLSSLHHFDCDCEGIRGWRENSFFVEARESESPALTFSRKKSIKYKRTLHSAGVYPTTFDEGCSGQHLAFRGEGRCWGPTNRPGRGLTSPPLRVRVRKHVGRPAALPLLPLPHRSIISPLATYSFTLDMRMMKASPADTAISMNPV